MPKSQHGRVRSFLKPLLIPTITGRGGSRLLMELPGTSLPIVFDPAFPFEVRCLTYMLRWALVLQQEDEARRLGQWLGVTLDPVTVVSQEANHSDHMTSGGGLESVARWQRELPADLNRFFVQDIGDQPRCFGYAT